MILVHIPHYLPEHNSGGEWYMHEMLKLIDHECIVIKDQGENVTLDGIKIKAFPDNINEYYQNAELVITHLTRTGYARNKCRRFDKPMLKIYHNNYKDTMVDYRPKQAVIYNSKWIQDDLNHKVPSMIFYPPIRQFRKGGKYVTLINCNKNKGGQMLIDLAREMPEYKFLGVLGCYGNQITEEGLPNLKYIENTFDIGSVFSNTHTLIAPSIYESFGMAACEAVKAGIRVIASPTPGLKESLNKGALFCKSKNDYISTIRNGENKSKYWKEPTSSKDKLNNFIRWIIRELPLSQRIPTGTAGMFPGTGGIATANQSI